MHIFFWFLILAVLSLTANVILLRQMKKKNTIHLTPVISITAGSYLLAVLLYVLVTTHGTEVLERTHAATFSIDPASYTTTSENSETVYVFRCDNGIPFRFDAASLLSDYPAAQTPSTVEVYSCQVQTGYRWCYLHRTAQVRYVFH